VATPRRLRHQRSAITRNLLAVENELNNRPRLFPNNRAPAELFAAMLASENRPRCDVD
jgi:hypothetical protein